MNIRALAQFAARTVDEAVRVKSASGGVFYELAKSVLNQGGVVIGAAWDSNLKVEHKMVSCVTELSLLQGSKYVPSNMHSVYNDIRLALKLGKRVLFSGLPCQTAAVRKMFGESDNIILCAIFCHSIPMIDVWNRYVAEIEDKYSKHISKVDFRDKRNGWKNADIVFYDDNINELFRQPVGLNPYMRAFIAGLSSCESCLHCQFKGFKCHADLLIGDFWGVADVDSFLDDNRGINAVIIYSNIGLLLLKESNLFLYPVELSQIEKLNPAITTAVMPCEIARNVFMMNYRERGVSYATKLALEGALSKRVFNSFINLPKRITKSLRRMVR